MENCIGDAIKKALTFDDVLLVPHYSEVLPSNTDITSELATGFALKTPIMSAAMDTVTESAMAESMARLGGLGIIHKNMPPCSQAEEVRKVKRSESGVITDPVTIPPHAPLEVAVALMNEKRISGLPVVNSENELVGILTGRDVRFSKDLESKVQHRMTPKNNLVTLCIKNSSSHYFMEEYSVTLEKAKHLFHNHRVEKIPLVNESGRLVGLVTCRDLENAIKYPNATKDSSGRLRVGAAVGVSSLELEERVPALVDAGVDVLTVDTAHGHSKGVLEAVKTIKKRYGDRILVMAGNIATATGGLALAEAGADVVKVGIGPGSICTTRIIAGVGVPQLTAVLNVANALKNTSVKVIADGGIKYSGDIVKALAAGAHGIMLGGLLAATFESPGERITYQGKLFKKYRGMGSLGAMRLGSKDRYFQGGQQDNKLVPEGIEGQVLLKGATEDVINQLVGGLRSGMGYLGASNLQELQANAQFIEISSAGLRESHVHDVTITEESPNYSQLR